MPTIDTYADGHFCWVDLMTPDVDAAIAFYGDVLGWSADRMPVDGGGEYVMFRVGGAPVAGAGKLSDELVAQGARPSWTSYANVDDLRETVRKATEAGAAIVVPPMDVMTQGRMAMVADPEGAVLGLWEGGDHQGAGLVNAPGALVWNELNTRDAEAAQAFYAHVFDWTYETDDVDGSPYTMIRIPDGFNEDGYNGGLMTMGEELDGTPPHWMVYFQVDDVDTTVEAAREAGAEVCNEPFTMSVGRMAVLADPQGAVFMVMSPPS